MSKSLERRIDELQLAMMAALEVEGVRIIDDEGAREIISTTELARRTGTARTTWIKRVSDQNEKTPPHFLVGRKIKFDWPIVKRWLEENPLRVKTVSERFTRYVKVDAETGCWVWTGAKQKDGYGTISDNGRRPAHRVSYERFVGPLIKGLTIDHLCRNRLCVNPDHLEQVTFKENVLRGVGPTAVNARKTHCIRGHELTKENILPNAKGRVCRQCNRKTIGQMAFGSDLEAERAFHRIVTAYDGGNQ